MTQSLNTAESQRELLAERVDSLEEQVLKDQDFIASLRARIANLSESASISQTQTPRKESNTQKISPKVLATIAEITPDSVIPFLQNRPLMLLTLINDQSDVSYYDVLRALTGETQNLFIQHSMKQLERFISAFSAFKSLESMTQTSSFCDVLSDVIRTAYKTSVCYVFLRDLLSGEFVCQFGSQSIQISLKASDSTVASVSKLQKPIILLEPQKYPDYSPSLDPLFNPGDLPEILIPVGDDAVFMAIKTDPSTPDYANEDIALGQVLSTLVKPLLREHVVYRNMMQEVEHRRNLRQFERELAEKTKLDALVPFLLESLSTMICANDANVFLVQDDSFVSFDVEDQRLVQRTIERKGTLQWVCENRHSVVAERLCEETPMFDAMTDFWAKDKPYAAYPVLDAKREVGAVICVAEKIGSNKFSSWDTEFMEAIAAILSLVLPICIKNFNDDKKSDSQKALEQFPVMMQELKYEMLEKEDAIEQILRRAQSVLNCEWISLYTRSSTKEGNEPDFQTKRVVTLRSGEVVDQMIAAVDFVNEQFKKRKPLVEPDVTRIKGFDIVGDFQARSLLSVVNTKQKEQIFVICLNCLNTVGQFDKGVVPILDAVSNCIVYAMRAMDKERQIADAKSGSVTMENVFKVTQAAISDPQPFVKLLEIFAKLTTLTRYCVYRVRYQKHCFESLVVSEKMKKHEIASSDVIFNKTDGFFYTSDFQNSEYKSSSIASVFPPFKHLAVQRLDTALFLVCTGDECPSNYGQLFSYFLTSLKSFARAYLPPEPVSNCVDFFSTKLLDTDVSSRLFVSTGLEDSQKTECVLKMFVNLGLLDVVAGGDLERLTNFVVNVRRSYNDVPFHNFDHALDSAQFVYACLMRNKFGEYFTKDERAALFTAALCHDIGHSGQNTKYNTELDTELVSLFGDISTVEKYHAQLALRVIDESSLTIRERRFLVDCITATDMERHKEYMEMMAPLANGFDIKDVTKHELVAFLLMKCGNVANTMRPFYFAQEQAKRLLVEYEEMAKTEKREGIQPQMIGDKKQSDPIELIELSFIIGYSLPLMSMLEAVSDEFKDFKVQVDDNREQWANAARKSQK